MCDVVVAVGRDMLQCGVVWCVIYSTIQHRANLGGNPCIWKTMEWRVTGNECAVWVCRSTLPGLITITSLYYRHLYIDTKI